jgi:hypothetical protein
MRDERFRLLFYQGYEHGQIAMNNSKSIYAPKYDGGKRVYNRILSGFAISLFIVNAASAQSPVSYCNNSFSAELAACASRSTIDQPDCRRDVHEAISKCINERAEAIKCSQGKFFHIICNNHLLSKR